MNRNRYGPLRRNDDLPFEEEDEEQFECDVTEEHCDEDNLIGKKKKHGVWCTILTKLNLKHRHSGDTGEKEKSRFKRRINFARIKLKLKKRRNKQSFDDVTMQDCDKDCLITLDKESSSIPGEPVSYRGRRVDIAIIPDRYDLLEEVDCDVISTMNDSGIHDDSLCSSDEQDGDDVMIVDEENGKVTMSEYLRKQWNGQRAKKTRRSIRRGSSYALKYLQIGVQGQNIIPSASQIAVAFQNTDTRGRR